MNLIYQPKGRAQEYCGLALNLYRGCTHGCTYCYVPGILRMSREQFHESCTVRFPDILDRLEKECQKYPGTGQPVLMCFTSDPFASPDANIVTTSACEILHRYGYVPVLLTKNPLMAVETPAMCQMLTEAKVWLGTTVTCGEQKAAEIEPHAPAPHDRIYALEMAKAAGIRTWVSAEPVIEPYEIITVLRNYHQVADIWKFGRLNHDAIDPTNYLRYTELLQEFILSHPQLRYYIKDDLWKVRKDWRIAKSVNSNFSEAK